MKRPNQQGDVILIPIKMIDETKNEKLKGTVVQEGEHTGHAHRFLDGNVELFGEGSKRRFLRVLKGGSTITHEEHLPQTIEQGDYEVRIVRQKDPFTKLVSKVVD